MNMNHKNKVIYTCITGNYDEVLHDQFKNEEFDYICFTDTDSYPENSIWQFRPLAFSALDNIRNQRWHKIHPHEILPEYEESIWIDGNIRLVEKEFFTKMRKPSQDEYMLIAPHPQRNSLYDEFIKNEQLGKDDKNLMRLQEEIIRQSGFDGNYQNGKFFESNVLWRRHRKSSCQRIMHSWWYWIDKYSYRDQLSLTYILWENSADINYMFEEDLRSSGLIQLIKGKEHKNTNQLKKANQELRSEIKNNKLELQKYQHELNETKKQLEEAQTYTQILLQSRSYRIGRALTYPLRVLKRSYQSRKT